jgi:Rrf2 family protein
MKLSTKGRYGLKAVYALARAESAGPVALKHVAEEQGIPEAYLEQLMASLRKAGLVNSVRGANGGYSLAKVPRDITVADVVQALEGPIAITECSLEKENYACSNVNDCVLRPLWEKVNDNILQAFRSVTVQDLLNNEYHLPNQEGKQ